MNNHESLGRVDRCLLDLEPPPGHILPIVTLEGANWVLATDPVPFVIIAPLLPLVVRFQLMMSADREALRAALHKLVMQIRPGEMPAPDARANITAALLGMIIAEMLSANHETFRPRDDEATAICVQLSRNAPSHLLYVNALKRRVLRRERKAHALVTSTAQ